MHDIHCTVMEDMLTEGTSMLNDADAETERCGICLKEVIDRGVLDCCDHWFCFTCIDNWAIITNLCPLCKAQFEIITCLPVYDTIGGSNKQTNSCAVGGTESDQNWYVYGKNNALSFPSYYIDEEAIICLDGDGCRVRAGVTTKEEDSSSLDTSVACDSCDLWYHAICVEFNPECTIENTWLCPRCKTSGVPAISTFCQTSPEEDVQNSMPNNDSALNNNVLVHVADAGETALVVSMVEGENRGQTTKDKFGEVAPVEEKQDAERISMPLCIDHRNLMQLGGVETLEQLADNIITISACKGGPTFPATNDSTSLLVDECSQKPSSSLPDKEINSTDTLVGSETPHSVANLEDTVKPSSLVENIEFCGLASDSHYIVKSPTGKNMEEESEMLAYLGNASNDKISDKSHASTGGDKHGEKNDIVEERVIYGGPVVTSNGRLSTERRKLDPKCRDASATTDSMQCGHTVGKTAKHNAISIKRARSSGLNEQMCLPSKKGRCDANEATVSKDNLGPKKKMRSNKLQSHTQSDVISPQVMSLVKGLEFPATAKTLQHSSARKTVSKSDNINSVRIKKIMPRRMDENKTSCLVQELRKELRIISDHDTADDVGKFDASDETLLAAFKAAMIRTHGNDRSDRTNRSHLRVIHQPLNRGKIRENLTKKLYGTGNGKRRAWEIEFWKDRCDKTKQLKKVEKPDSIMNLLKKSLDSCSKSLETKQMAETEVVDPIFSRLYIADTSLFPRKDDIKPLSAYLSSGNVQVGTSDAESNPVKLERTCNSTNSMCQVPCSEVDTAAGSVHPTKQHTEIKKLNSSLNSATLQTTVVQQKTGNSSDVKLDKRKWALEVLARKKGSDERKTEASLGKMASFPLLIQLPSDMRPILPHNRQSRVPTAVRQMQLNRLVEHYLKNANLETIRRTAESEFAVADAVNKENEIYERANCKSVYINLCAQALSGVVSNHNAVVKDDGFHRLETELRDDISITEALKAAGLISDSPPGSPYHITENNVVETDIVAENKDNVTGRIDNVLDLDCHPDLDIYGDFEYDLEDLEIPGPSNISKKSNSSSIPDIADSNLKVILSTVQQSKHSSEQLLNGEKDKDLCLEQVDNGALKPLLVREEFIPEAKDNTFPSVDDTADMQVRSGIEGSAIPDIQIEKIDNLGSSSHATEDIETHMPKVDPGKVSQCDLGLSLRDPSANLIGSQDQGVSVSLLMNDQVSNSGLESASVNSLSKGSRDETKQVKPPCHGDSAISEKDKLNSNSEIKGKVSLLSHTGGDTSKKDSEVGSKKQHPDMRHLVRKKVEAYIKEHIRPLCKSGVVTVEQYRWAVGKTVEKVMKYHHNPKSADFLITEGNKVKKLSEQYLQAFKQKENH